MLCYKVVQLSKESNNMKTLNMILFVSIPFSVVVAGLLHNQIVWNVAIASIGAFALSGIICYISDLVKENKLW